MQSSAAFDGLMLSKWEEPEGAKGITLNFSRSIFMQRRLHLESI